MPEKINESEIKQPDALRRQLVKGGLATPVVLATLASKQVLGAAPYNCTISGKMSGNASGHGQAQACGIGRSPGYWKYPNAPQFHTWPASSWAPGNPFYGSASGGAALLDAFHGKTLLQVLCTSGGNNGSPYAALARAVIATVLNSVKFAPNYAISGSEAIQMYNSIYSTSTYQPKPGVSWGAGCCTAYLESLYQLEFGETAYGSTAGCTGLS